MSDIRVYVTRAWRQLAARPGFTLLVVGTLALTIGLATAVFSLFDAILLRPFPYHDPDRLVRLRTYQGALTTDFRGAALYDLQDWQRAARGLERSAAWITFANNLTGIGPGRSVRMTFATADLFPVLGITPALGRTFTAQEDVLGGDVRKAVLSHALWQQVFAGSPDALGRIVQLRGQSYEVIGVLPPRFDYPDRTEVWVPLMARYSSYNDGWWKSRDVRIHSVIARLRPGVTLAQAQAEMDAVASTLAGAHPETNGETRIRVQTLRETEAGQLRPYVLVVGGAVAVLLLLGCVNVAGLFIARAAARAREMAVRAALGAEVGQIVRQLLTESLLYALLGGAAGVVVAFVAVRTLDALVPVDLPDWMHFGIDARVLAFCSITSVLTAMLFGLTPILQHARPNLEQVLRQSGKGRGEGGATQHLRRGLIVIEVALSAALLIGAGLMLRSLGRLVATDPGVRTEGLLLASVGRYLPNVTMQQQVVVYSDEFRRMREALAALPGVRHVGGGYNVPFFNTPEERSTARVYTRRRATRELAHRSALQGSNVMPGFFDALDIPLLEGRDFTESDTLDSQPVAIISQHAAEVLFPGQSALGQELRWGTDPVYDPWMTVVGVVSNTTWQYGERTGGLEVYWCYRQFPGPVMRFLLDVEGDTAALIPAVRRTLQTTYPEFVVDRIVPLDEIKRDALWQRRLWGFLLGVFAAIAALLTGVGLYGVMSYLVTQRTRELGLRMAIGAGRSDVIALVLRQGLRMTVVGLGLGLISAALSSHFLRTLLFEVSPFDIVTFVATPILLGAVAATACAVPAWRASRVDPLIALREDV